MRRKDLVGPGREPPVLLVKWYDMTRWILEKVDSFPKSQRFIFGTRLADHAIDVLETSDQLHGPNAAEKLLFSYFQRKGERYAKQVRGSSAAEKAAPT